MRDFPFLSGDRNGERLDIWADLSFKIVRVNASTPAGAGAQA